MDEKALKLKKNREDAEAALREATRKERVYNQELADKERKADTRRKVIDGAHIQAEAETNPEIAALLGRLRSQRLIHDADRALFKLAPLPAEEKARRLELQRQVTPPVSTEPAEVSPAAVTAAAADSPKLKMVGK